MGKEEAFFLPAAKSAMAGVTSARSWTETLLHDLGTTPGSAFVPFPPALIQPDAAPRIAVAQPGSGHPSPPPAVPPCLHRASCAPDVLTQPSLPSQHACVKLN